MAAFQSGTIHIKEKSTTQANADAGWLRVYAKTDGSIYRKDENGVEYRLIGDTEVASISGSLQAQVNSINVTKRYLFPADAMDTPNSSDWVVNAFAPASNDTLKSALIVRRFDDTLQEGVGIDFEVPTGATNVTLELWSRSEATNAGNIIPVIYTRYMDDNAALSSWTAGISGNALAMTADQKWQKDTQTFTTSALSISGGQHCFMEVTRNGADGSDTLVGDWTLFKLVVSTS